MEDAGEGGLEADDSQFQPNQRLCCYSFHCPKLELAKGFEPPTA